MKHLIKTSLLFLALFMPLSAMAYDFVVDGVYYMTDTWGDFAMVCEQGEDGGLYSGEVTIPESVTNDGTLYPVRKIGAYAFNNCTELTSVKMPASIKEISDHAFENCSALSNVMIPDAVTVIGPAAFKDCASITQINIPASVTEVHIWAFENCTSLTDVYCHIADPSAIDFNSLAFTLESENYANRTLHVPAGSVNAYKETGWNDYFGNIVEM